MGETGQDMLIEVSTDTLRISVARSNSKSDATACLEWSTGQWERWLESRDVTSSALIPGGTSRNDGPAMEARSVCNGALALLRLLEAARAIDIPIAYSVGSVPGEYSESDARIRGSELVYLSGRLLDLYSGYGLTVTSMETR